LNILNDSTQGHEVLAKADEMEAQKERSYHNQSAADLNGSAAHSNMKSHSEVGALCADETGMSHAYAHLRKPIYIQSFPETTPVMRSTR